MDRNSGIIMTSWMGPEEIYEYVLKFLSYLMHENFEVNI